MNHNQLGAQGAANLDVKSSALTVLDLSDNQLSSAALSALNLPPTLKTLYLSGNDIDQAINIWAIFSADQPQNLATQQRGSSEVNCDLYQKTFSPEYNQSQANATPIVCQTRSSMKFYDQLNVSLELLDLSNNRLNTAGFVRLLTDLEKEPLMANSVRYELNHLQWLVVSGNNITQPVLNQTTLPQSLELLDLSNNRLNSTFFSQVSLPAGLRVLVLNDNAITSSVAMQINLPRSLEVLSIGHNPLANAGLKALLSQASSNLQWLFASHINVSTLQGIPSSELRSLHGIDLSGNQLCSDNHESLTFDSPHIRWLSLSGNGHCDPAMLIFSNQIRELSVSNTHLGQFSGSLSLPSNLITLDLSENGMTDAQFETMQLPENLQVLLLSSNALAFVNAKKSMLPSSVRYLELINNSLTDSSLSGLDLPYFLEKLYVGQNEISIDTITRKAKTLSVDFSFNIAGQAQVMSSYGVKKSRRVLDQAEFSSTSMGKINKDDDALPTEVMPLQLQQRLLSKCTSQICHNIPSQGERAVAVESYQLQYAFVDAEISYLLQSPMIVDLPAAGGARLRPPLFYHWMGIGMAKMAQLTAVGFVGMQSLGTDVVNLIQEESPAKLSSAELEAASTDYLILLMGLFTLLLGCGLFGLRRCASQPKSTELWSSKRQIDRSTVSKAELINKLGLNAKVSSDAGKNMQTSRYDEHRSIANMGRI